MAKPIPTPSILEAFEPLGFIAGARRWRSHGGLRIYSWDALHGEIEVYNSRGRHLGAIDPIDGHFVKTAVKGRRIDV